MSEATTSHVEMTCPQGLTDLERLEGPWLNCMGAGEPESVATVIRLMLAHMAVLNKKVMSAMVLDRLDMELGMSTTMSTPQDVHRDVHGPLSNKKRTLESAALE